MIARNLHALRRYGKYRVYEYPVRQGHHVAEVFPRGLTEEMKHAQGVAYMALLAAAPKLLAVAKLALSAVSHSNDDWKLRVRPLLEEAVAEAEDLSC